MTATGYNRENLERWFDYIEQRIIELRKDDFGVARNEWLMRFFLRVMDMAKAIDG